MLLGRALRGGEQKAGARRRLVPRCDSPRPRKEHTAYLSLAWILRGRAQKEIESPKKRATIAEADKLVDQLVEKNSELAAAVPARAGATGASST